MGRSGSDLIHGVLGVNGQQLQYEVTFKIGT
jgi:hypothetical protein